MFVVKVLEKKAVIQFFGVGLILAPAINTLISMTQFTRTAHPWTFIIFWKTISSGTTAHQLLYVASIIIGFIMLQGSKAAWKFALALLAAHIALQITHIGEDIRKDWISGPFFLFNVLVFFFIADQLAFKQQKKKAAKVISPLPVPPEIKVPIPTPPAEPVAKKPRFELPAELHGGGEPLPPKRKPAQNLRTRRKVFIHFDGVGPWAQLISISKQGVHMRSVAPLPFDIGERKIEICLKQNLVLRTLLVRQEEQDYFFEYQSISSDEIRKLNQWIQQRAA